MNQTIGHIISKLFTHMSGTTRLVGFLAMICLPLAAVAQDTIQTNIPQAQLRRNRMAITITDTLTNDSTIRISQLKIPTEKAIHQFLEKKTFIPDPKGLGLSNIQESEDP